MSKFFKALSITAVLPFVIIGLFYFYGVVLPAKVSSASDIEVLQGFLAILITIFAIGFCAMWAIDTKRFIK